MPSGNLKIYCAIEYIDRNFSDPSLSLRDVATASGLSRAHLSRAFKRELGVGFRSHVQQRRLEEATHLLGSSSMSIKEIAAVVGFRYTSDLDRHMKRTSGVTPSLIRANSHAAGTRA